MAARSPLKAHPPFMDWKAAGGKPVKGKASVAKAREFEAAIRRDAKELGLIST